MKMDFADRARALVGTRFRPQGRGPDGLDCIGLVLATFDIRHDRRDYELRGHCWSELEAGLARYFRRVPPKQLRPGDVVVMKVRADQLHLGVKTTDGLIHAHAGIRRVVETPGSPQWPVVGVYRKRKG